MFHFCFVCRSDFALKDQANPEIIVNKPLDYERQYMYRLRVVAQDHGLPPLSSTAIVDIRIVDENDNRPVFTQALYSASVGSDTPIG